MIHIGKVKEVTSANEVIVEFEELGTAAMCIVVQTLANSWDIIIKKDETVACVLGSGKNICLGVVYSNNSSPSIKSLFGEIVDILKNMDLATPAGPTRGILPNVLQKVNDLEKHIKDYVV